MGTLYAMAYPTPLFLNLADHTYVKCAGSKAWSCWGGSTGGRELNHATGSTNRANEIAEPNERAGITCYLINGVCHQAANRILLSANITVAGARGYSVSESIYGPYGRPRGPFGFCPAPFNQHDGVTGDLHECTPTAPATGEKAFMAPAGNKNEQAYLEKVRATYGKIEKVDSTKMLLAPPDLVGFQLELFNYKIEYNLGEDFNKALSGNMLGIRKAAELNRISLEESYANNETSLDDFVKEINAQTIAFQHEIANALPAEQYMKFFNLSPDETVVLADPKIVAMMPPPAPGDISPRM